MFYIATPREPQWTLGRVDLTGLDLVTGDILLDSLVEVTNPNFVDVEISNSKMILLYKQFQIGNSTGEDSKLSKRYLSAASYTSSYQLNLV